MEKPRYFWCFWKFQVFFCENCQNIITCSIDEASVGLKNKSVRSEAARSKIESYSDYAFANSCLHWQSFAVKWSITCMSGRGLQRSSLCLPSLELQTGLEALRNSTQPPASSYSFKAASRRYWSHLLMVFTLRCIIQRPSALSDARGGESRKKAPRC